MLPVTLGAKEFAAPKLCAPMLETGAGLRTFRVLPGHAKIGNTALCLHLYRREAGIAWLSTGSVRLCALTKPLIPDAFLASP